MSTDRLDALKKKYANALELIGQLKISLQNLHVQDNKLFIKGHAKRESESNHVWDEIKRIDKNFAADLSAQFTFDIPLSQEAAHPAPAPQKPQHKTHTIKSGDTLSALAKHYYGNAKLYMKIFEANRDKMPDPNRGLHPGDVIVIPHHDED
jgi:LysM repeat protein